MHENEIMMRTSYLQAKRPELQKWLVNITRELLMRARAIWEFKFSCRRARGERTGSNKWTRDVKWERNNQNVRHAPPHHQRLRARKNKPTKRERVKWSFWPGIAIVDRAPARCCFIIITFLIVHTEPPRDLCSTSLARSRPSSALNEAHYHIFSPFPFHLSLAIVFSTGFVDCSNNVSFFCCKLARCDLAQVLWESAKKKRKLCLKLLVDVLRFSLCYQCYHYWEVTIFWLSNR